MSFFSSKKEITVSPIPLEHEAEACAAVLIACLRANELDSDEENAAYYSAIHSRNIFKGYDSNALIAAAVQHYENAGSSESLIDAAIPFIREQTRMPLFYHCLDVILADGLVTPTEHKIFLYLKRKFRVSDEVAAQALEVLLSKNQL